MIIHVCFLEEVMEAMMKELGKYGCQLPQFGKIGGILASELPVDEAALHAAVIAVNEAVEKGVSMAYVVLWRSRNACLVGGEWLYAEAEMRKCCNCF